MLFAWLEAHITDQCDEFNFSLVQAAV